MPESIDLHGMTRNGAKEAFIEFYTEALQASGGRRLRLEVIHGYGSTGAGGVIRGWLRGFLDRHLSYLEYQIGENVDSNQGHTFVTPLKPLPSQGEELMDEIMEYCEMPRAQSKIMGKFRRHGESGVLSTLKLLEKQKRLSGSTRGSIRTYHTV